MALRHDLVSVLPFLKKKYLKYSDYKEQTMEDIFGAEQVKGMQRLDCYRMESSVLLNKGGKGFEMRALPVEAQLSPIYGIEGGDWDGDGKEDLIVGGNFYQSKPEVGIYDGSYGLLLKGDGKGGFTTVPSVQSGIQVRGAVRDIITIDQGKQKKIVFALNNGSLNLYHK